VGSHSQTTHLDWSACASLRTPKSNSDAETAKLATSKIGPSVSTVQYISTLASIGLAVVTRQIRLNVSSMLFISSRAMINRLMTAAER